MKVMYVSHRFETNVCATMHLQALKEMYGEDNVFIVDLRTEKPVFKSDNRIVFGPLSTIGKIKRALEGNSWYLTNSRIDDICKYVKEKEVRYVFIDESIFGKLIKKIKKECPGVRVISFYHDIAQDLYRYWYKTKGRKFYTEMKAGIKGEKITSRNSDVNLVLNERDRVQYVKHFEKEPDGFLPTAVAEPFLEETLRMEKRKEEKVLLFVGSLYQPNIDGLNWFVENVFTKLDKNYSLMVVGRGLEKLKAKYDVYDNILIIGGVDSLAPYYNFADIVIAPLFDGGGMKQKTAEAIAYGKVFVGTTESLQGYEKAFGATSSGKSLIYKCDTEEEFASAFKKIDTDKVYGYHRELTDLYNEWYSVHAIKRELSKWMD